MGVGYHAGCHQEHGHVLTLYFFPGLFFIIFSYLGSFMVVWGLGLGSYIGFLGLRFSAYGVWGLWCGFFGLGLSIQT